MPVIALTATATVRVMEEVAESLQLEDPAIVRGDFGRPNLALSVELIQSDKERTRRVVALVKSVGSGRAVVTPLTSEKVPPGTYAPLVVSDANAPLYVLPYRSTNAPSTSTFFSHEPVTLAPVSL